MSAQSLVKPLVSRQASFDFDDESVSTQIVVPAQVPPPVPARPPAPLDYELRVSSRARRMSLRVVHGRGLVVTIPKRYPRRDVPQAVESYREWALEALADLDAKTPEIYREWPPRRLDIAATGERVLVVFQTKENDTDAIPRGSISGERYLVLSCDSNDREAVAVAVASWLRPIAKSHLTTLAARLASRHGASYQRLSVRGQRSVWGSYSSSGTLSLNYKLLFLRPELVEYVVLHELAHTRYLDHSTAFWQTLEAMMPGARALDAEIADAGQRVPPWLELAP